VPVLQRFYCNLLPKKWPWEADWKQKMIAAASALWSSSPPMTAPKTPVIVRDYDQLLAALRARAAELELTHEVLDDASGLSSGYASKLLCDPPIRHLGRISLGCFLGAVGLKLVVVEDVEALARIRPKLVKRKIAPKRKNADTAMLTEPSRERPRFLPFLDPAFARSARARGVLLQSPQRRRQIARVAARARWARQAKTITPKSAAAPPA
jgi:hypothetical protein